MEVNLPDIDERHAHELGAHGKPTVEPSAISPSNAHDRQIAYWRKQLARIPSILPLPTDRPRHGRVEMHREQSAMTLPGLAVAVEALAARENTQPITVYLAAYLVLLSRFSGQHEVVVGVLERQESQAAPEMVNLVSQLSIAVHLPNGLSIAHCDGSARSKRRSFLAQ